MKKNNEQPRQIGRTTPASAPVVRVLSGPLEGREFSLRDGEMTLGRSADCDIRFPAEARGVSGRHCLIRWNQNDGSFTVRDLGSSCGTWLETGMQLQPNSPYRMKTGEVLILGGEENSVTLAYREPSFATKAAADAAAKKPFPVLAAVIPAAILLAVLLFFLLKPKPEPGADPELSQEAEVTLENPGMEGDGEPPIPAGTVIVTEAPEATPAQTTAPEGGAEGAPPSNGEEPPELGQQGASLGPYDGSGGGGAGDAGGGAQ